MNRLWAANLKGGPADGTSMDVFVPGRNFDDPSRCQELEVELGPFVVGGVDWKVFESEREIKHFLYRQDKPSSHTFKYVRTAYLTEKDIIERYGD